MAVPIATLQKDSCDTSLGNSVSSITSFAPTAHAVPEQNTIHTATGIHPNDEDGDVPPECMDKVKKLDRSINHTAIN